MALREELENAYDEAHSGTGFQERIAILGATKDELLEKTLEKYTGTERIDIKTREALQRILAKKKEEDLPFKSSLLAPVITSSSRIIGIEDLFGNLTSSHTLKGGDSFN